MSEQRLALHDEMRRLWEDHITWTRLFIVSASADLPDTPATTKRLLRNQQDIGDAIKPFYGRAAGERLTTLLQGAHRRGRRPARQRQGGDQAAVERHSGAWYRNARDRRLPHAANPRHWARSEMRAMMREHLDLTLTEAVAHLEQDHRTDIRATTAFIGRSWAWRTCSATESQRSSRSDSANGFRVGLGEVVGRERSGFMGSRVPAGARTGRGARSAGLRRRWLARMVGAGTRRPPLTSGRPCVGATRPGREADPQEVTFAQITQA